MATSIRIAIAQANISPDVVTNGEHIRDLMEHASKQEARLIHFSEGALSGYVKAQIGDWADVDWSIVRQEFRLIRDAARRLGLWVVVGCNHELTYPNRPHNSLFAISDEGEIVTRYDKRFCSATEIADWYSPGRVARTFDIDGFRFGFALCIEIQFMDVFAEYERLDVDCILFSAYSNDPMFWTQVRGYAACNNFWITVSTPAQCSHALPGGLIGPDGEVIARCDASSSSNVKIVTLDRNDPKLEMALNKARPWRRKARSGMIYVSQQVADDPRSTDVSCE